MKSLHRLFLVVLLSAGLLAGGLQVPVIMKQNNESHDKQVVEDLERISATVEEFKNNNNGKLPGTLADTALAERSRMYGNVGDRLEHYKYIPKSSWYELCATFRTDASSSRKSYSGMGASYYGSGPDVESHKKGEQCFTYSTISDDFNLNDYFDSSKKDADSGSSFN